MTDHAIEPSCIDRYGELLAIAEQIVEMAEDLRLRGCVAESVTFALIAGQHVKAYRLLTAMWS